MKQRIPDAQRGFILLYVVVAMTLVAAIAFALSNQSATRTNIVSGELQRDQLRYIAEAGVAHAAAQLSKSTSCDGYTDVPSTPFGAGSYVATIAPVGGSPVSITGTGTLANGAVSTVSQDGVRIYDSGGLQKITLQPGPESKDTYIEDEKPSDNYGDQNILMSDDEEAGNGPIRSLLQFDMSSIPSSLDVVRAELSLYVKDDANDQVVVEAHRLLQSWTEGTGSNDGATWNTTDGSTPWSNPGTDYDPALEGSFAVTSLGWKSMYITSLVQSWVDGSQPNNGLVLLTPPTVGNNEITYHSSDESDPSLRPKLTVTVACECGQICVTDDSFLFLSTDSDAELGGLSFQDKDLAEYDRPTDTATLFLDSVAVGMTKKIDALHVLANGHLILSVDAGTTFAGLSIGSEDLFEYDPVAGTATMFMEADIHFQSKKNVISVHILNNGNIVLSTDDGATLGGLAFSDRDLVEYNPVTGNASIFFDGDDTSLSRKISAVHVRNNGHIILAADGDTTLGGLDFGKDQLIDYDPVTDTALPFFDGSVLFTETSEFITAAHVGPGSGAIPAPITPRNILFVVGIASNLTNEEEAHQSILEFWGHTLEIIDDGATQTEFDTAVARNDVVFTTNDITASNLGTKLVDATIGVVTSEVNLSDELGLSSSIGWNSDTSINIDDNTHYITTPFPLGSLEIVANPESLAYLTGSLSPDLGLLASSTSGYGVVTLESGATMFGGGSAAGRRVQLPWGGSAFDPDDLNAAGLSILQRAIDWGAGASGIYNVLMVVSDPGNLTPASADRKTLMESWGYTVNLVDDNDSQAIFDAGIAAADVVYIGSGSSASNIGTKLDTKTEGIVNEPISMASVLGFASSWVPTSGLDQLTIIDSSQSITQGFASPVTVFTSPLVSAALSGTLAPDLHNLAEADATPALAVLESGAATHAAGIAFGRRAQLPFATAGSAALTAEGQLIVRRALEWAANSAGLFYLDEFSDFTCDGPDEYVGSSGSLDWSAFAWTESGDDGEACGGDIRVMDDPDIVDLTGNRLRLQNKNRYIEREVDLSSLTTAYLSYDYRRDGISGAANIKVEVSSNGGSSWTTVGTIAAGDDFAYQSASHDISSYIASDTMIRFSMDNDFNNKAYMDNIRVDSTPGSSGGGGGGTIRDEFNAKVYSGSDGVLPWASDWLEIGESDGATGGDIQVRSDGSFDYVLRVRDNNNGGEGVEREVDLSACSSSNLSFDYRRKSFDTSNDYVTVDVSDNGGTTWTEFDRLAGPADESSYQSANIDITSAIATNTRIRFLGSPTLGDTDELFVDNVVISCL